MAAVEIPELRFFDIDSKLDPQTWSPNTLRTALALRLRRLPYQRTALSYPDIAGALSDLGVPPGPSEPAYTLPALQIGRGTIPLMGSDQIAKALDKLVPASPDHPALLPDDEAVEYAGWVGKELASAAGGSVGLLVRSHVAPLLDDRGAAYFRETRNRRFGKDLDELRSKEEPGAWEDALRKNVGPFARSFKRRQDERGGGGPFGLGETATYGDVVIVAMLQFFRLVRGSEVLDRVLEDEAGGVLARLFAATSSLIPKRDPGRVAMDGRADGHAVAR